MPNSLGEWNWEGFVCLRNFNQGVSAVLFWKSFSVCQVSIFCNDVEIANKKTLLHLTASMEKVCQENSKSRSFKAWEIQGAQKQAGKQVKNRTMILYLHTEVAVPISSWYFVLTNKRNFVCGRLEDFHSPSKAATVLSDAYSHKIWGGLQLREMM